MEYCLLPSILDGAQFLYAIGLEAGCSKTRRYPVLNVTNRHRRDTFYAGSEVDEESGVDGWKIKVVEASNSRVKPPISLFLDLPSLNDPNSYTNIHH